MTRFFRMNRLGGIIKYARSYKRYESSPSAQPLKKAASTGGGESVPIGSSLASAFAGISVVSAAAAAVEFATSESCLPYSSNGQRFNQDKFVGRFCRMLLACDPWLLIYRSEEVREAQALLERAEEYKGDRSMDRALWEARRIVDGALHPDTKEIIPHPFRMSGYVPFNGPVCIGMLTSLSLSPLLFWSWVNQSQNALVNYYNRNASSPMSNETLLKSYSAAVGSALAVAFGLATMIQKRYSPEKAKALMKFVAFPSAVVASSLNCYIVRSPEIDTGVPLLDSKGKNVMEGETSIIAAKSGVESTTMSRALLQAPVYFLPPLLMGGPLRSLLTKRPSARVPLTAFLVLVSFGIGLPATVAIFPQIVSISPEEVETKFQHLQDPDTQKPYKIYYYNKGL